MQKKITKQISQGQYAYCKYLEIIWVGVFEWEQKQVAAAGGLGKNNKSPPPHSGWRLKNGRHDQNMLLKFLQNVCSKLDTWFTRYQGAVETMVADKTIRKQKGSIIHLFLFSSRSSLFHKNHSLLKSLLHTRFQWKIYLVFHRIIFHVKCMLSQVHKTKIYHNKIWTHCVFFVSELQLFTRNRIYKNYCMVASTDRTTSLFIYILYCIPEHMVDHELAVFSRKHNTNNHKKHLNYAADVSVQVHSYNIFLIIFTQLPIKGKRRYS